LSAWDEVELSLSIFVQCAIGVSLMLTVIIGLSTRVAQTALG
jgi:hypothetical protein